MNRPTQTVVATIFLLALLLSCVSRCLQADEPQDEPGKQDGGPICALLVTGGCCHDYARQKLILTRGISARANVQWTVAHQGGTATDSKIPLYEDPNWSQGFAVVVHNECFSNVKDTQWVDNILKPHREGLPAVLIHCAMHCYRTGDDRWFEFVGMQSPGHGAHYPFTVEPYKQDHFIMAGFDKNWTVPKGELYHSMKLWTSATPLASAKRKTDAKPQVCVWTNQYRQGRVFGTTIGHYNETMVEPQYLDMVTRGLLWAVNHTEPRDFRKTDAATDREIKKLVDIPLGADSTSSKSGKCCGAGNLAFTRKATASSEETSKNNLTSHAVDGDLNTRWCAANGSPKHQWQVDLGAPRAIQSVRIHWEMDTAAYRYQIHASKDGQQWKTLVDASANKRVAQVVSHQVDATESQWLRVEFLGSSTGAWGSIREFEAYDGKLPDLPKVVLGGASIGDVQAPDEFDVTLFGAPPQVTYPVCLTAAATGELFVGVDEQGSLGKEPGRGRILRCIDQDGDGRADRINEFAKVDHPRGLIYDAGTLWVLHPPFLSRFIDDDLDGVSDRQETLIEGISTEEVSRRGADHTTNGIRMGIDGWIYIAVGDFGFVNAKAKDGTMLSRRGGGIVRIRPDGSQMEVYAWGLRNILDVCIDPYMNIFTRDNTNDGGGWNVRLSQIFQSANYGYPSLYMNFADEIMPPLRDYGGGSGCGGMFLHDARWPAPYGDAVYTCDWGRSEVYRHNLPANGPTFDAHQEVFAKIPRPTDVDVDGSGRMYVSSWKNGKFSYSGDNVGFVAQITPRGFVPKPFPNLPAATISQLTQWLSSPSAAYRLHSQREILRRSPSEEADRQLETHAADSQQPLWGRVAAIYTLKQWRGAAADDALLRLCEQPALREFSLRALTDRQDAITPRALPVLLESLKDKNPRVVAQAIIGLGRLADPAAAPSLLPLAMPVSPSTVQPAHAQPRPTAVVPHLAVRALVDCQGSAACLEAIGGPLQPAALRALRVMHEPQVVHGLIGALSKTRDLASRHSLLTTLIRLYYREGAYTGGWWGTRPDTSGPYYDRKTWEASSRIGNVIKTAIGDADSQTAQTLLAEVQRHKLKIAGLKSGEDPNASSDTLNKPILIAPADPNDPRQIGNLGMEKAMQLAAQSPMGNAQRGRDLFARQSCAACHTVADGQTPKGPHLVDIGKRYQRNELIESILKPSAKIAQGFDTYAFQTSEGTVVTGFVASESAEAIKVRQGTGVVVEILQDDVDRRAKQPVSMMPQGIVNNMTIEQLADLLAYLDSIRSP